MRKNTTKASLLLIRVSTAEALKTTDRSFANKNTPLTLISLKTTNSATPPAGVRVRTPEDHQDPGDPEGALPAGAAALEEEQPDRRDAELRARGRRGADHQAGPRVHGRSSGRRQELGWWRRWWPHDPRRRGARARQEEPDFRW